MGFQTENGNEQRARNRRIVYLIIEVLSLPEAARGYHLSQTLNSLYPTKWVLEVADRRFNPIQFAKAGNCELRDRSVPHSRWLTSWRESDDRTETFPRQA